MKITKKKRKKHINMAISKEALASIISHNSSTLCTAKGDKMLNEYKSGRQSSDMNPDDYHDQWDNFSLSDDTQTFEEGVAMPSMQYTNESIANSKMDEKIKQSMMSKRIDTRAASNTSFLNEMVKPKKQQPMREARAVAPTPTPIDYGVIKAIFNECLKEYFSKNPINESAGSQSIAFSEKNNKIRIIKENGDVYGGKLTYQGNINDKNK